MAKTLCVALTLLAMSASSTFAVGRPDETTDNAEKPAMAAPHILDAHAWVNGIPTTLVDPSKKCHRPLIIRLDLGLNGRSPRDLGKISVEVWQGDVRKFSAEPRRENIATDQLKLVTRKCWHQGDPGPGDKVQINVVLNKGMKHEKSLRIGEVVVANPY